MKTLSKLLPLYIATLFVLTLACITVETPADDMGTADQSTSAQPQTIVPTPAVTAYIQTAPSPSPTKTMSTEVTTSDPIGESIIGTYFVSETGGDGIKPRKNCSSEADRAFFERVPEGTRVKANLKGVGSCLGWYFVGAADISDTDFWIQGKNPRADSNSKTHRYYPRADSNSKTHRYYPRADSNSKTHRYYPRLFMGIINKLSNKCDSEGTNFPRKRNRISYGERLLLHCRPCSRR